MRLIDAELLEEILRSRCAQCSDDYGSLAGAISGCLKLVQAQPTIAPLKKGGSDATDNIWPACRSCNHYKSTLTVEQFRAAILRGK